MHSIWQTLYPRHHRVLDLGDRPRGLRPLGQVRPQTRPDVGLASDPYPNFSLPSPGRLGDVINQGNTAATSRGAIRRRN
jgi:hypothetical protein